MNFFSRFILFGASPSDWLNYRFWEKTLRMCSRFITAKDNFKLDKMYNPRELCPIFNDKVLFNKTFFEFVKRRWIYTKDYDSDDIRSFVKEKNIVIVKPIGLSSGRGIYEFNTAIDDIDTLINSFKKNDYLLEERAVCIPELERLNPPSCQTIRYYTMVRSDGSILPLGAGLRVGGGESIVDNFHAAGTAYPIDIDTGIVYAPGIDINGNRCIKVPSTGCVMPGFQIPRWNDVKDFCEKAARLIPQARWIGWDVAITPNGCEMIEGNVIPNHNFLQIFDQIGRKKELYSYK